MCQNTTMEHGLKKDTAFYAQKHLTPRTVVITSPLVRDKPLWVPASVKRVYIDSDSDRTGYRIIMDIVNWFFGSESEILIYLRESMQLLSPGVIFLFWWQGSLLRGKGAVVITPPEQRSCWRVYWFHSVRLSVPLSVRPSRIPCPLCSSYSSGWIHFIFIHVIKQLQKVCHV